MTRKLITAALPYVNNVPHLGNLIQGLSADVFARFCRMRGYHTCFVCGTDEYGTASETRAAKQGLSPAQLCAHYHALHRDIYQWFDLSFDYFGRTTSDAHTELTQALFRHLDARGFISEHESAQAYCLHCARFLADRYLRGTCPHCRNAEARADQCEHCGVLLEPETLLNARCVSCGTAPEFRPTRHLYLNLPALEKAYRSWFCTTNHLWTKNAVRMTEGWLRTGLQERAITRDLRWGVPVPKAGFEQKVFYVWFDAPVGYISITKCGTEAASSQEGGGTDDGVKEKWQSWWLDQQDVELVQFVGKDNIPFHTLFFPCMLIGSGQRWTMLTRLSATEYLNYEGGKFSKSLGVGVFGSDAKESGIPSDLWRFYLLYHRPEKSDAHFTWHEFQERVNSELIGNLCNLVNRTLTFVARTYGGVVPAQDGARSTRAQVMEETLALREAVRNTAKRMTDLMEQVQLREAFREVFALSARANKALQDGAPWKTRAQDRERADALMRELCYVIRDVLILAHPFLPWYTQQAARFLGVQLSSCAPEGGGAVCAAKKDADTAQPDTVQPTLRWSDVGERKGLTQVHPPVILFRPLETETIAAYRARYAGTARDGAGVSVPRTAQMPTGMNKKETDAQQKKEEREMPPPSDTARLSAFFSERVVLKVARVLQVERHPNADMLFVETLDDGSGVERVIVSGLVPYMAADALRGAHVLIVDNLQPRSLRGVRSCGMLLAAEYVDAQGTKAIELVQAPWALPGERATLASAPPVITPHGSAVIDADAFFSVPIRVVNYAVEVAGEPLMVGGRPLVMQRVKEGTVG